MRAIILHTARVDNSRTRRPAGDTIEIGDEPRQIDADTAAELVAGLLADDADAPSVTTALSDAPLDVLAGFATALIGQDGRPLDPPEGNLSDAPVPLDLTDDQRAALAPLEDSAEGRTNSLKRPKAG